MYADSGLQQLVVYMLHQSCCLSFVSWCCWLVLNVLMLLTDAFFLLIRLFCAPEEAKRNSDIIISAPVVFASLWLPWLQNSPQQQAENVEPRTPRAVSYGCACSTGQRPGTLLVILAFAITLPLKTMDADACCLKAFLQDSFCDIWQQRCASLQCVILCSSAAKVAPRSRLLSTTESDTPQGRRVYLSIYKYTSHTCVCRYTGIQRRIHSSVLLISDLFHRSSCVSKNKAHSSSQKATAHPRTHSSPKLLTSSKFSTFKLSEDPGDILCHSFYNFHPILTVLNE